jgi:hypothetical protein
MGKMDATVVQLQKADPTGQMTRTQALERVRRENPKLAREMAAAMRGVAA